MGWRGVSGGKGGEERGSGDLWVELDDGYLIYRCHGCGMMSTWTLQRFSPFVKQSPKALRGGAGPRGAL